MFVSKHRQLQNKYYPFYPEIVPEKIQVSKEDLAELQNADAPQSNDAPAEEGGVEESNEVSLDEIAENDQQEADNSENSEQ